MGSDQTGQGFPFARVDELKSTKSLYTLISPDLFNISWNILPVCNFLQNFLDKEKLKWHISDEESG